MKGVILAAGRGTRLWPVTRVVDKTVLPVYNKPIIYYAIDTAVRSGVSEILIVVNSFNRKMIEELVGDGKQLGAKVWYKTKNHNLGMPFSIAQAKEFTGGESVFVVPGDNLFFGDFRDEVREFRTGAWTFIRNEKELSRFGVAKFSAGKLVDIVEKPKNPPSKWAIIAPYLFDNQVFDLISELRPSLRGELEIVDLLKLYMAKDQLELKRRTDYWADIGTFEALTDASYRVKRLMTRA